MRAAAGGAYPAVFARTDRGLEVVLTTAQIEACGGSPAALVDLLNSLG